MKKLIMFLFIIVITATESLADISAGEALNIAMKEYSCYGINIKDEITQVIRDETFEYFWSTKPHRESNVNKPSDSIRGKRFWSVCFYPKDRRIYGGLLSVYIDASNGQILGFEPMSPKEIMEYKQGSEKEISLNEALGIAEEFLQKEGIDISNTLMTVIQNNIGLLKYYPEKNVFMRNGIDNLDNCQNYWLFYYRPKGDFENSDIGIVIDTHSGEILKVIR